MVWRWARGIRGVSGEELQELLKGDVTLVDVRSAEKYRQATRRAAEKSVHLFKVLQTGRSTPLQGMLQPEVNEHPRGWGLLVHLPAVQSAESFF